MVALTKGYSFVFQLLGHFTFKMDGDYKKALLLVRNFLEDYLYEKVVSEMPSEDRKFAYGDAKSKNGKEKQIKDLIVMADNEYSVYSVYRNRLVKRGVIDGDEPGYVRFTLPMLKEFIVRIME